MTAGMNRAFLAATTALLVPLAAIATAQTQENRVDRLVQLRAGFREQPELMVSYAPIKSPAEGGIAGGCSAVECTPQQFTHTSSDFGPGSYILQAGIIEGEMAAVSYTVDAALFPLRFDLAEMIFGTSNATMQTITEWSIIIWEGTPASGQIIAVYRSLDGDLPQIVLPPGTSGVNVAFAIDSSQNPSEELCIQNNGSGTFSVGYRIDKHSAQPASPLCGLLGLPPGCCAPPPPCCNAFPAVDVGGLQVPAKNWLFAVNCDALGCAPGWKNFQQLPAECRPSGDWVIRASVTPSNCAPSFGACCFANGNCDERLEADCIVSGGQFQGAGVSCSQITCSVPTGACCYANGTCDTLTAGDCAASGGVYKGNFTTCATQTCPVLIGACCFPNGSCSALTLGACVSAGGTFQGNGTSCATASCPVASGPCCFVATGNCIKISAGNCLLAGGIPGPAGQSCAGYVCFPEGACCLPNGDCVNGVSPSECAALNGFFQGNDTSCAVITCPEPEGACCFATGFCLQLTELDCVLAGSTWIGPQTNCADGNSNGTADACEKRGNPADLDGDGDVDGADLGLLLTQWGGPGVGDITGDGVVDGADLGELLAAWTG